MSPEVPPQPGDIDPTQPNKAIVDLDALVDPPPEEVPLRVAIVDQSHDVEDRARDLAMAEMTSRKANLAKRVWRGMTRPYAEQRAIHRHEDEIVASGSIYGDAAAQETNDKLTSSRFAHEAGLSDQEASTLAELGDTPEEAYVKNEIKALMGQFLEGSLDEANFNEASGRVLTQLSQEHPELMGKGLMYAENILEVAKQIQLREETLEAQQRLLGETEVILGEARNLQRTEAHYTRVDRVMEKMSNVPVLGKTVLAHETGVAIGLSAAFTAASYAGRRVAGLARLGTIGVGSSLMAGAREHKQFTDKRQQHLRERAVGEEVGPDSPQRERMEPTRYETRQAIELRSEMFSDLMTTDEDGNEWLKTEFTPEEFLNTLTATAEVIARQRLGDAEGIDLIAYSDVSKIQEERFGLSEGVAQTESYLRRIYEAGDEDFQRSVNLGGSLDEVMQVAISSAENRLQTDVEGKDEVFKSERRKAVAKRMVIAGATGVAIGAAFQEVRSVIDKDEVGVLESSNGTERHHTALRGLRDLVTGQHETLADPSKMHQEVLDQAHAVKLPASVSLLHHPDGSYGLIQGNKPLADGLHFQDGVLDSASADKLHHAGIMFGTEHYQTGTTASESVTSSPREFLDHHPEMGQKVNRNWMDNDTSSPNYDRNELGLDLGMGQNGHYQYNIGRMTEDGSFEGPVSVNAREMIAQNRGQLLVSLSADTQATPIGLPIIDGKVDIDPNGPYGYLVSMTNGKPHLAAAFAEVGDPAGKVGDAMRYNILATDIGRGFDSITHEVTHSTLQDHADTVIRGLPSHTNVEVPPFMPIATYTNLEPTQRRQEATQPPTETVTVGPEDGRELEPGPQPAALEPGEAPKGPESEPIPGGDELLSLFELKEWAREDVGRLKEDGLVTPEERRRIAANIGRVSQHMDKRNVTQTDLFSLFMAFETVMEYARESGQVDAEIEKEYDLIRRSILALDKQLPDQGKNGWERGESGPTAYPADKPEWLNGGDAVASDDSKPETASSSKVEPKPKVEPKNQPKAKSKAKAESKPKEASKVEKVIESTTLGEFSEGVTATFKRIKTDNQIRRELEAWVKKGNVRLKNGGDANVVGDYEAVGEEGKVLMEAARSTQERIEKAKGIASQSKEVRQPERAVDDTKVMNRIERMKRRIERATTLETLDRIQEQIEEKDDWLPEVPPGAGEAAVPVIREVMSKVIEMEANLGLKRQELEKELEKNKKA